MTRFFRLIEEENIAIEKFFEVEGEFFDGKIVVQAGLKGWVVTYTDSAFDFDNCDDTAENNFQKALESLKEIFPNACEIKKDKNYETFFRINAE